MLPDVICEVIKKCCQMWSASHHPLKTFQPTVNISFLNCTKYNTVTMFSSNAFNGKGDNNGRCFDNLRLMLSSKYNGLTTSYLEASHIPTLPSTIEPSDKVEYVKKNKKLIWLQSSCDSSVWEEDTDLNYFGSWHDKNYELIQVRDESCERAYIFLDHHPAKKHSFVSLVQRDENWDDINKRNKLIDYGLLGVSLFRNKNRSNVSYPNNGYQFFGGWHRQMQKYVREYAMRSTSGGDIKYLNYKVCMTYLIYIYP